MDNSNDAHLAATLGFYKDELRHITGASGAALFDLSERAIRTAAAFSLHQHQILAVYSTILKHLGASVIDSQIGLDCMDSIAFSAAQITVSMQIDSSVALVKTYWRRSENATAVLCVAASEMINRALKSSLKLKCEAEQIVIVAAIITVMSEAHLTLEADILSITRRT